MANRAIAFHCAHKSDAADLLDGIRKSLKAGKMEALEVDVNVERKTSVGCYFLWVAGFY